MADDRADLLRQIDGWEVEISGEPRTIATAAAEVRTLEMDSMTRLFNFLASPDIAVLLVMAGLLGLYIEFNQPGAIIPNKRYDVGGFHRV